jgi:ATP-dependent Clp protease ATP-binding subunit ClpC
MVGESTEAVGAGVGGGSSGQKMPTLEEYGTNLTKLAEEVRPLFHYCLAQFPK